MGVFFFFLISGPWELNAAPKHIYIYLFFGKCEISNKYLISYFYYKSITERSAETRMSSEKNPLNIGWLLLN